MDKKNIWIWALITGAAILGLVCLGLMIWGAVILGVNINQNTGDYQTFLLGGLLTGINAFIFLFINLNLFSYLSSHKYLINQLKAKVKCLVKKAKAKLRNPKSDTTERI